MAQDLSTQSAQDPKHQAAQDLRGNAEQDLELRSAKDLKHKLRQDPSTKAAQDPKRKTRQDPKLRSSKDLERGSAKDPHAAPAQDLNLSFENQTSQPVKESIFLPTMQELECKYVELLIVDDETIRALNSAHRGKGAPTDVLSFPLEAGFANGLLGSVVISIDTASRQAAQNAIDLEQELQILFLHGLLHLLGYDHETDTGEMAQKEEFFRKRLGLKTSLIKRAHQAH
ncbi:MAG: rRNA maturation RNase YbeY [Helicobacteraceae bacterium]